MAKIKFFYNNLVKTYTPVATSEHANFPVENLQHRDFNKAWHSEHEAGSGWGNFKIEAGVNDELVFRETTGVDLTAQLTAAEYNADTLAAHIKTQMEAVGASTYTPEYLESSNKFKVTSNGVGGGGIFEMYNTGDTALPTIGFTSSSYTGALNYTADAVRIHSEERVTLDLGSAQNVYGIIIRGHNFSGSATVDVIFSSDNWSTIAEHPDFTVQDDIMILEYDSPKNYRYVGMRIKDIANPDFYVKAGVLFFGGQFQPTENFLHEGETERIDPSIILESEAGQESSIQQDSYDAWAYTFRVKGSTQKGYFDTMFDAVGTSRALFVCEDPDSPLTTTKYVRFTGWTWTPIRRDIDLWYLTIGVKEQR